MLAYRREVDGLRALAVIPVILFHAGFEIFRGGFIGVDVFFVISGYLITSILLFEKKSGAFSLLTFYERRARRILPALFIVMATSAFFAWMWLLPRDMKDFSGSIAAVSVFASNIFFWSESGYFDTKAELKPLLHTWSLGVEEQYYLLFPFFLMFTWKLGKHFSERMPRTLLRHRPHQAPQSAIRGDNCALVGTLLLTLLISLAIAQIGVQKYSVATFYLLPTRAWELALGALTAFYLFEGRGWNLSQLTRQLGASAGLLLIVFAAIYYDRYTPFPSFYALVPTVGASLIILCATPTTLVGKLLGLKVFVGIGLVSYSAYLWHQPLFAFARYRTSLELSLFTVFTMLLLTAVLAFLSWRFIESPFRKKRIFGSKGIIYFGILCSLFFLIFGFVGHTTEGNFYRYDAESMEVLGFTKARADFLWARANHLYLKQFNGSTKHKVLVIGDSMAADFVNVLYETEYYKKNDISFYTVDWPCGNLYLDENFTDKIDKEHRQACLNKNWFNNSKIKELLGEADHIILASVWVPWQIELLGKSINNLERDFGKGKFFVVGRKSFGSLDLEKLSSLTFGQRLSYRSSPHAFIPEFNKSLSSKVKNGHFFDLGAIICEGNECPLFDRSGRLMSYDGSHLTPAGAKYVADKLSFQPFLKSLLDE